MLVLVAYLRFGIHPNAEIPQDGGIPPMYYVILKYQRNPLHKQIIKPVAFHRGRVPVPGAIPAVEIRGPFRTLSVKFATEENRPGVVT